jgi:hypothetical protein
VIYVLTPDNPRPSGGTRVSYLMVDVLRDLGYDAAIFHGDPGFRCSWFDYDTPVVARPFLRLARGDVLVVPEYRGGTQYERCKDAAVVICNQNHFRTFLGGGFDATWPGAYPGWPNAQAVLVTSNAIEEFMTFALRAPLPVHRIRLVVDTSLFTPATKRRRIALMFRKRRAEAETVVQLLTRSGPEGWEITPIGEMPQADVARVFADSALFLSFSQEEGFGLPPAEAMAAGCYVVGFTGDGGREFMDPQWCSPIADENVVAFAQEAARVARAWERDPEAVQRRADRGREFVASQYTLVHFRDDVGAAFADITAPGSPALQRSPATVTHWSVPVGPRGSLVRAQRRVVRSLRPKS